MASTKQSALSEFARRAMQSIQDKKIPKRCTLHVPSLDMDIKIRNLDYNEIVECVNMDESVDVNRGDKYSIYLAAVEPNLKEIATEIMAVEAELPLDQRTLMEALDIVTMFTMSEITDIATQVMELSGAINSKKVTVVEQLKN